MNLYCYNPSKYLFVESGITFTDSPILSPTVYNDASYPISLSLALTGNIYAASLARNVYRTMSAGILLAFLMIVYTVFTHQFEYHYVWNYSSKELQAWYLFAASYAGQEGSFMLWTLWV